jgi:hypothetical protein
VQAILTGGKQGDDGEVQTLAVARIIDLDTGDIIHTTEYLPSDGMSVPGQDIHFTGHCFVGDLWCVCTFNEVLIYDHWPPRTPVRKIADRGFNDLHHCMAWNGCIAVSNTGLETVDVVSLDGELLERHDLLADERKAGRIDASIDWRLVPDTKPHVRHGNHLFALDGKLWTSQAQTFDAVCVTDPSRRFEMKAGMPHDGTIFGDRVGFTTTNGYLVFFDIEAPHDRTIYNLTAMTPGVETLGWCRGMDRMPGSRERYLVGFSALRRSKWKEFGYWIKHGHDSPKTRVALYDLEAQRLERTWFVGDDQGFHLFQLDVLPPDRCL